MSKHRTPTRIRTRLLSGLLCLALVLGLLPAGTVLPAQAASWADPYGQQLVDWGIMRGDIAGNLNLSKPISRAEFVTMCNRAFGYDKLGTMPFTDVPSYQWYAEDINIAYNAGYFKGTSDTLASPMANLTREQAAVLLARNLMLRETPGESLGFSDSRTLSEWSRGLIAAAVAEGMINGYSDGSFRPFNNITRGEVAAMLVRVIGTPINKEGNYTLGDVYGNVMISSSNVTLRNTTIAGNLYITGGVDLGNVLLENVTVLGRIVISGAGESNASQSSIILRNVEADELVVDSMKDQFVTIRAQGVTDIPLTSVRSDAYIDDSSWPGYGLHRIELDAEPGTKLQLAGNIKEVINLTPSSDLQLVQGSAEKITIDEYAKNSQVLIDKGTRVDELNLDVATLVIGDGDIKTLNIGAPGCEVDILPDTVVIRPGITAIVDGEEIGSVEASELSSQPRLMAGYPTVGSIAPTQAEALLCGNKAGTIYWAISALADGSVSEEDLIKNPVYGGNIFKNQAGSISASAKTEYGRAINELEPDGSYYISAIMVDGRGKRSPLKVAAFSTPDNTVPAFVPEEVTVEANLTKNTTAVAQVTVTANKNCLLYWALLPENAKAPTPQEFKTGSLGGNFGYGSLSMVKNVPTSINVNRNKLQEKTTYELYLWLTDHNGAQSMETPAHITFTTPDETPPIVTSIQQIAPYSADGARVSFAMNEAPATLHWAVVAEGDQTFIAQGKDAEADDAIMSSLATKIKVESGKGAGAITGGATDVANAYTDIIFNISELITDTTNTNNYILYYVGKDAAGNYSAKVESIPIRTLDTWAPTVGRLPDTNDRKCTFTNINGDNEDTPLADTGIKLIFSEQVKGYADADDTFYELYQNVLNAPEGPAKTAALDTLETVLSEHILLYYVPRTGQAELLNGNPGENGEINFRNARITMENGKLVIFLPGEADRGKNGVPDSDDAWAVKLKSGATYYFNLQRIYDDALTPNGLAETRNDKNNTGNLTMERFTTVYAQVNIESNTRVPKITADDRVEKEEYRDVRFDVVVDVMPTSTNKVPETECWDMIMWSDTNIDIQVYCIDTTDENSEWKLLNDVPYSMTIRRGDTLARASLGGNIIGTDKDIDTRYPVIPTSLVQGHTYRYGFHFSKVNGVEETDDKKAADSWGDLVTMHFALIAGGQGDVNNASIAIKESFNDDFTIKAGLDISYISTAYTSTGTGEVLEVGKRFQDTRVPSFTSNYPSFTKSSSTIEMSVMLNRPGTVYYVAAPAGTIMTTLPDETVIKTTGKDENGNDIKGNDGTVLSNGQVDLTALNGKSYIPTSGADREVHKDLIHFMTGGPVDKDGKGTRAAYSWPNASDVVAGRFPGNANVFIPEGPVTYVNTEQTGKMTGLLPDTVYYIYTVLEGSGDHDTVVEVYRVKTDPVKKPEIKVSGNSDTATVTPSEDANIRFVLVELNALPTNIFGSYYGSDGKPDKTSVIYQMINTVGGSSNMSLFDRDGDPDEKKLVYDYIIGDVRPETGIQPVAEKNLFGGETFNDKTYNGPISKDTQEKLDFSTTMTAPNSEYVLLVMGRHPYGGTDPTKDYAFGAINSLYTPDKKPPVLQTMGFTGRYISVTRSGVFKLDGTPYEGRDWVDNPDDYTYSGTVTINFDKDIYVLDKSVRYDIYYEKPSSNTDRIKELSELLGGGTTIKPSQYGTGRIGSSFVLQFDKIPMNYQLNLFPNGRICNSSSYPTGIITLIFDPTLTDYDFYGGIEAAARPMCGFRVLADGTQNQ